MVHELKLYKPDGSSYAVRNGNANPQKITLGPGLSIWKGMVREEYLPALQNWSTAVKIYKEMQDDVVIGALLESIKTPLLSAPFKVRAVSESSEDTAAADFLERNLFNDSMDMEWFDHVEDMLEFLDFGFALSEKVLEKRSDGKLWLRSLVPIGQETLYKWGELNELGDVTSFIQRHPVSNQMAEVPMSKMLHFTFRGRKRNPHGKSLMRSLYRPWFFKKNLEALEAVGVERDVGNAPIAKLGEGFYSPEDINDLKKALAGFRMDEEAYLITPHGVDIVAYGGGSKVYDVRGIIRDWQHLIRQRFFADFLSMGAEQVGTQALAREMTTFFSVALRSIQSRMLAVWNRQLIPWLFSFNAFKVDKLPQLAWTLPGQRNLQTLAQAYNTLVSAGLLTPDASIEAQIREEVGLPPAQGSSDVVDDKDVKETKLKYTRRTKTLTYNEKGRPVGVVEEEWESPESEDE